MKTAKRGGRRLAALHALNVPFSKLLLGAARTSAYYAVAPFIGVGLSLILFRELPGPAFFLALVMMAAGVFLASEKQKKKKTIP